MGLGEDPDELLLPQRVELDANGKPALQLRNQIRRFRSGEGACRDEQDVVRPDHPVTGVHRRSLYDRQEVPLDAFPGDIRSV